MAANPSMVFYNPQKLIPGPARHWCREASFSGKHIKFHQVIQAYSPTLALLLSLFSNGHLVTPNYLVSWLKMLCHTSAPLLILFHGISPNLHLGILQVIYSIYYTNLTWWHALHHYPQPFPWLTSPALLHVLLNVLYILLLQTCHIFFHFTCLSPLVGHNSFVNNLCSFIVLFSNKTR